jgi:hypothetical protein
MTNLNAHFSHRTRWSLSRLGNFTNPSHIVSGQ